MHGTGAPSPWVTRWTHLIPPESSVLDLACGAGRHTRWFTQHGCRVTAVDRDAAAVAGLEALARVVLADVENGPWPLSGERFDAVVITNYLWRPLWPVVLDSLSPGGVLLVETFALGHERLGRPRNPDFLLRPGELLQVTQGLHVVAFEDGLLGSSTAAPGSPPGATQRVQRVVACRPVDPQPSTRGDWPLHDGGAAPR